MTPPLTRRQALGGAAGAALSAAATAARAAGANAPRPATFRCAFNTGTIRGQKLPVPKQIDVAADAGYDAIEPWLSDIAEFTAAGGRIADLRKQLDDRGLAVCGAITFAQWVIDDPARRAAGVEKLKAEMEVLRALGGTRMAAPLSGATKEAMPLLRVAERYRAILELGRQTGVAPHLELWGRSKTVCRLGEAALVLIEADHPEAAALLDTFHIHCGGSSFSGLERFPPGTLQLYHMNDYPGDIPREKLTDAARVFPGDGIAPTTAILRSLAKVAPGCILSLELFNPLYYKQDPLDVARRGLAKMKAAVAAAQDAA